MKPNSFSAGKEPVAMETTDLSIKETALQEQISEKRTQLSGLYLSLGQKYYEFHRNDAEPAMQSAVEAADAAETELRQLESQLKKLKDGLICSSCGAELSEGDRFCPGCGNRILRNHSEEDNASCPRCGTAAAAGQRFCVKCGCPLSEEPEESTENTSFEPKVPAGPAVCPSCGEPVDDDMAFCISCGYRLKR